jgi:uncharacterized protein YqeY
MKLLEQIQKDMTDAMRARDERRLSALRMMKTALKLKEVEKTASELTDADAVQVLATMIKQRKDSIDQFTRGGRAELAEKEAAEIAVIEAYMPKAASEDEIRAAIQATIAEMGSPTMKDMGGKVVSDLVKQALTK